MQNSNASEKISGRIENVVYSNDKNGYTVIEISDEYENLITAVGIMPMAFEGEEVTLFGRWTYHKEFGKQFAFDSFEKHLPEGVDGILQYLSSRTIKGIGPVTALKIVNRFGADTFDVIENRPEWLADIPGITHKKAMQISESFKEQADIRSVMMLCKDYIGTSEVVKTYKRLGAGATGLIEENPYILCDGEIGIPFEKVDALARSLGTDMESDERMLAAFCHVLSAQAASGGHTCLPRGALLSETEQLISLPGEILLDKLQGLIADGKIAMLHLDGIDYIMRAQVDEDESFVASAVNSLISGSCGFFVQDVSALIEKAEIEQGLVFAEQQRLALASILNSGMLILTGGPGTGKTTVIKAMISVFKSLGLKCALAAPTGRAAKRMSEATSREAKTVHRLLEMERGIDGEMYFTRNRRNPISEDVVIVDEASMLDLSITASLFRALKRGARLILIGDADQLPSVGSGNVLYDLISSGVVPTVRLNQIFRQGKDSLIVSNAHKINSGEPPVLTATDADFFFVRREVESEIADSIANLITERLPKKYGAGIKEKIQVITPSRKGACGVERLNELLQEKLNPKTKFKSEKQFRSTVFREGDRVMQIVNNYDVEWEKNGKVGVGLFNGDIGTIEKINLREETVKILFDDRYATYSYEMLEELELAYAITVHKSQGSEYPVVIIPMYQCPPMLMTRNLFYTAVTRARSMVLLVGRAEIPYKMVENNRIAKRYTALKHKILALS